MSFALTKRRLINDQPPPHSPSNVHQPLERFARRFPEGKEVLHVAHGPVRSVSSCRGGDILAAALRYRINLQIERATPWPRFRHFIPSNRARAFITTITSARKVITSRRTIVAAARAAIRFVTGVVTCNVNLGGGPRRRATAILTDLSPQVLSWCLKSERESLRDRGQSPVDRLLPSRLQEGVGLRKMLAAEEARMGRERRGVGGLEDEMAAAFVDRIDEGGFLLGVAAPQ